MSPRGTHTSYTQQLYLGPARSGPAGLSFVQDGGRLTVWPIFFVHAVSSAPPIGTTMVAYVSRNPAIFRYPAFFFLSGKSR